MKIEDNIYKNVTFLLVKVNSQIEKSYKELKKEIKEYSPIFTDSELKYKRKSLYQLLNGNILVHSYGEKEIRKEFPIKRKELKAGLSKSQNKRHQKIVKIAMTILQRCFGKNVPLYDFVSKSQQDICIRFLKEGGVKFVVSKESTSSTESEENEGETVVSEESTSSTESEGSEGETSEGSKSPGGTVKGSFSSEDEDSEANVFSNSNGDEDVINRIKSRREKEGLVKELEKQKQREKLVKKIDSGVQFLLLKALVCLRESVAGHNKLLGSEWAEIQENMEKWKEQSSNYKKEEKKIISLISSSSPKFIAQKYKSEIKSLMKFSKEDQRKFGAIEKKEKNVIKTIVKALLKKGRVNIACPDFDKRTTLDACFEEVKKLKSTLLQTDSDSESGGFISMVTSFFGGGSSLKKK